MEDAGKWVGYHKGRDWNYRLLAAYLEITPQHAFERVVRFLAGNTTWDELFKPPELSDPEITLSDSRVFKCSEIMEISGEGRPLVLQRMRRVKLGQMREETLFKAKDKGKAKQGFCPAGKAKQGFCSAGRHELPPERCDLLDDLQMTPEQIVMQEKYCPLHSTPVFQGKQ